MNILLDALYNVHTSKKTAKELLDALDHKYKSENVGTKRFGVDRFLDYKIVDCKTISNQVEEFQVILHEIHPEEMVLSKAYQVATIIQKLPRG